MADYQTAMFFAFGSHCFESLKTFPFELGVWGNDRIPLGLELVVIYHDVTGKNGAKLSLAPAPVDIYQILGGYAASLKVLEVP